MGDLVTCGDVLLNYLQVPRPAPPSALGFCEACGALARVAGVCTNARICGPAITPLPAHPARRAAA